MQLNVDNRRASTRHEPLREYRERRGRAFPWRGYAVRRCCPEIEDTLVALCVANKKNWCITSHKTIMEKTLAWSHRKLCKRSIAYHLKAADTAQLIRRQRRTRFDLKGQGLKRRTLYILGGRLLARAGRLAGQLAKTLTVLTRSNASPLVQNLANRLSDLYRAVSPVAASP